MIACWIALVTFTAPQFDVTFDSLLRESCDRAALARWPAPEYQTLQASSYNRESVRRDLPGWFADSDGTGFIRTEGTEDRQEFVMMEHNGPGAITKIWTPFFYYDFNDRKGPNVRIYLDGNSKPTIDEPLIDLVCGKGSVFNPWAVFTARAGDLYLPIPFAKSAKVTMARHPFYFSINYRAYNLGTKVETFSSSYLQSKAASIRALGERLTAVDQAPEKADKAWLAPGAVAYLEFPSGSSAVERFDLRVEGVTKHPESLRSTVLSATFDREETVWCPIGDFFCSADAQHPFHTYTRSVADSGWMTSQWTMPFRKSGQLRITNYGKQPVAIEWRAVTKPWTWDRRSMHFFARWRPDDIVPGKPFSDWNFVDVKGKGVYVGDAWTVLNIRKDSWWGEGDEKVYIDRAWEKGFPTHFGTGSEDYYGWAGGVYPVLEDQFSTPFLANVKIGGLDGHTLSYNILTRARGLDAVPFHNRLRFDMESSFGTDMREVWNLLGYSVVTYWYAFPGATHNRPAMPEAVRKPIMSIPQLQELSDQIHAAHKAG